MDKKRKAIVKEEKKPMTKEELRAFLPKKLNKFGVWLLSDDKDKDFFIIKDMKAVLK